MRGLIWTITWLIVAVWSAVAALTWWVIDGVTGLAARHADQMANDPVSIEWINTMALWLQSFGSVAMVIVWGLVALVILAFGWIIAKLAGNLAQSNPFPPART